MAGIVVENKDNGMRYAISESNFDPDTHTKIRDLKPGETVRAYIPRPAPGDSESTADDKTTTTGATKASRTK